LPKQREGEVEKIDRSAPLLEVGGGMTTLKKLKLDTMQQKRYQSYKLNAMHGMGFVYMSVVMGLYFTSRFDNNLRAGITGSGI
jgi:hypothetical protein